MTNRTCPHCGTTWYSAAAEGDWECGKCGAKIPEVKHESN